MQLEILHGVYMIPVRINDAITVPFVLDSGASEVAIPADVFLTLRRTGTVKDSDRIESGVYVLADGSTQSSERFILRKMGVGDHVIESVVANVISAKGDPLLGQNFLSKLPTWTVDNTRHTLVFQDGAPVTEERSRPTELVRRGDHAFAAMNAAEAMRWYRDAADQGSVVALSKIGDLYQSGLGVPRDHATAMTWYRKAADQGNADAQDRMGEIYQTGDSVPIDYGEAMRWYRRAADQGHPRALGEIGFLYAEGRGVRKNCTIARQWLERAATANDEAALFVLGLGVDYRACRW